MKFAAIALASALAALALAQPSFAQQNQSDQSNQKQYGPGAQNEFRNEGEDGWRQGRNWRGDDEFGGGWRRMHGAMMDRMERRNRFANEGGAHFRLRRGQAMLDVKCPENESLQACVNAAGQLLDKVAGLRNGTTASGTTNGAGLSGEMSSSPPSGSSASPGGGATDQSGKLPGQD